MEDNERGRGKLEGERRDLRRRVEKQRVGKEKSCLLCVFKSVFFAQIAIKLFVFSLTATMFSIFTNLPRSGGSTCYCRWQFRKRNLVAN